jgi:hypothetical protein
MRQEAEERAAAMKREAEEFMRWAGQEAAAKLAAAEQEAAEMRAAVMKLSTELTEMATHLTTNLIGPTKPVAMPRADPPARSGPGAAAATFENKQVGGTHKTSVFATLLAWCRGRRYRAGSARDGRAGHRSR